MKKILTPLVITLFLSGSAFAAQQAVTEIGGTQSSIGALKTQVNTRLSAAQSNFTELYDLIDDAPFLAQASAPSIHNILWIDTSGESPLVKYWDGDSWEAATASPAGTYTLPVATASVLGGVKQGTGTSIAGDGTISVTASGIGLGTSDNPSFNSVHASGGNLAAANKQVTKAWQSGLSYTADVTSVIHGGKHWIAKTTHTAGSTTEPGVGASYTDAWKEVSGSGDNLGSATYSNVVALWALGECSGYLKSDGTCSTPSVGTADSLTAQYIDWSASSGGASIANKPTLGTAAALNVGTGANQIVQLNSSGQLPFTIDVSDLTDTEGLFTAKANASCFTSESAFNACFPLTWATGGATNLDGLSDVVISGTPTTNYVLKFNGTNWVPAADETAAGAGYVSTPPTYSDEACTNGQYALSESYRYDCIASGNWKRTALTDWSNPSSPVTRTLTVTSPSNGTITCSDADLSASINCGTGGSACTATAADGASITGITAAADSGYAFSSWTGDLSGTTNPTSITMSANRGIGATFASAGPTAYAHFTGSDATLLSSYTSDSGHTWALSGSSTLSINSNAVYASQSGNPGLYYSSAVPTDADYSVSATVLVVSSSNVSPGVAGRISTSSETGYMAYWANGSWALFKTVSGSRSTPATYAGDVPTTAKVVTLRMVSDTIKVLVDGVERISYTDPSPITSAGRPGVGSYYADALPSRTIDDWEFYDL